ncbi:MAG: response regulator [Bryobacteraceae bacterium]
MSILVVDSEPVVLKFVQLVVGQSGQKTFGASTPQQALRFAARQPTVNLLLTEVELPQKSGLELARDFVRKSPRTNVLFMAAYIDSEWPFSAPIICKPFAPQTLLAEVAKALAQTSEIQAKLSQELHRAAALRQQARELQWEIELARHQSAAARRRSRKRRGVEPNEELSGGTPAV